MDRLGQLWRGQAKTDAAPTLPTMWRDVEMAITSSLQRQQLLYTI